MISRLINEFFISKGYLKFGDAQLKNVIKCIPSSSEFVPLMVNTNPELLAFKNGVLNKRTGEFLPHNQENYLTSFLDVDYSTEKQATPHFNKWLDFVSDGNPKYKDPFDDRVRAVFIITGNEPMIFTENNGGVDRRRIIFKFDNVVPKENRDYYLINKIREELNGIINLLLETFQNPITALNLLEEQKDSLESMQVKEETDHLLDFLNAFHTKEEAFARGLFLGRPKQNNINHSYKEYLLSAYDLYCRINDIHKPISKNKFKEAIKKAAKKKKMNPPFKISIIDGKNRTNFYFNNPEEIENEWLNS